MMSCKVIELAKKGNYVKNSLYRYGLYFFLLETAAIYQRKKGRPQRLAARPISRAPRIEFFLANGLSELYVEPGVPLVLSWRTYRAGTTRINRISAAGPFVQVQNPPGNTLDIGPFTESRPVDALYELVATNFYGTVRAEVKVHLRRIPELRIIGIEIIQSIQNFFPDNRLNLPYIGGIISIPVPPEWSNNIRLVSKKRTIVRVYVDSGIRDGFDNGGGPNTQAYVYGSVRLLAPGRDRIVYPINTPRTIIARPSEWIVRQNLAHTLNFELDWRDPWGWIILYVDVWVRRPYSEPIPTGRISRTFERIQFQNRRHRIVVRILVRDSRYNILPEPTPWDFELSLGGARARFPIANDGFILHIAPGFEVISTSRDLNTRDGWEDLLDDLDDISDDFEDWDQIWAALVPNSSGYAANGIADAGFEAWYWWDSYPRMIAQRGLIGTFSHEMGHTFGLGHSPCPKPGEPGAPGNIDFRLLDSGKTDVLGIDVGLRQLFFPGGGDLMSYCDGNNRWPSSKVYNILFDSLPP
jgi:hypothetical protein